MGLDHGITSNNYEIELRKVNAIHRYFVAKYGELDDDGYLAVPMSDMRPLMLSIRDAVARRDPSVFPPVAGFFWGSTEIDERYWRDLTSFACELEHLIAANPADAEIEYWAWW